MDIAAGIITYPIHPTRLEYLEYCIKSLKQYVFASRHDLGWFVSCESDTRGDIQAVRDLCSTHGLLFYLNPRGPCMGANQNNAMRVAFDSLSAKYLLLLIDDCHTDKELDVSIEVDMLDRNPEIDILRYHWSDRPGGRPAFHGRGDGYMQVDPTSVRFYDDSPHIRRSNYVEKFGWNTESIPSDAGRVERLTNQSLRDGGASIVATPSLRFGKGGGVVSACRPETWDDV